MTLPVAGLGVHFSGHLLASVLHASQRLTDCLAVWEAWIVKEHTSSTIQYAVSCTHCQYHYLLWFPYSHSREFRTCFDKCSHNSFGDASVQLFLKSAKNTRILHVDLAVHADDVAVRVVCRTFGRRAQTGNLGLPDRPLAPAYDESALCSLL